MTRWSAIVLAALTSLASCFAALAAAPPTPDLAALAQRAGLTGDDLSPVFRLENRAAIPPALLERPHDDPRAEQAASDPAVRVHYSGGSGVPSRDTNLDGVPDRVEAALRVAVRTLKLTRALGLGNPADDGDRELDLYLVPLHGIARGYDVLDLPVPPGRGAAGFAVVDASAQETDADFEEMVARLVARLVLAGHDASAPPFWTEASVLWIAERVTGLSFEMERAVSARWNHPERGLLTDDPLLARGNVGLFWSLENPELAGRALSSTWSALAARPDSETALAVIDANLRQVLGLGLLELELRAAAQQVVSGGGPSRWAARVQSLPLLDTASAMPVAPLGLALVRLAPDAHDSEGTRVTVITPEPGWTAVILARRRTGGWDKSTPAFDATGNLTLTVPWNDYDQAALLLAHPAGTAGEGLFHVRAEASEHAGLYALSSFGARVPPSNVAEITWSTAWEEGLFGWVVERATLSDGPWEPVLATPVPALGLPHEGSDYIVQDTLPAGRARVFYRIVVLTADGLRVTGPSVAVRPAR